MSFLREPSYSVILGEHYCSIPRSGDWLKGRRSNELAWWKQKGIPVQSHLNPIRNLPSVLMLEALKLLFSLCSGLFPGLALV